MTDISPERVEAERLCSEASGHLERGEFAQTLALLTRARQIDAGNALVHYRLGLYFLDLGQAGSALKSVDESIRIEPTNAKAHNNRGSALQQLGRLGEAEQAFRQAQHLDPSLMPPYLNLGYVLEKAGRPGEAARVYEQAIGVGLDKDVFEQHRAAALGLNTPASPESWVRTTFDNFAPMFDARLKVLGYRVPLDLAAKLAPYARKPSDILDLGCGTGQCGRALKGFKGSLTGVDLSPKMLQVAQALGIYDTLSVAEVKDFLRQSAAASFDIVIAADVFIYIGDLEDVFGEVSRVLRPGGVFAFSTEEVGPGDFTLRPSGRYAQSRPYIERLARPDFSLLVADPTVIRLEDGVPLGGRLYVLRNRRQD